MTAIGYVRQSRRADLDIALSPEQQEADIRRMAAADGNADVTIYHDLGRSGGAGKERHRRGYQAMLAELETGGVTVLYAKALTRLARSVTELYRVLRVAQEHGTVIVTAKEGRMDPGTPIGKAQFGMLAVFAEFERDLAVERAKDNVSTRRARGDRLGRIGYGDRPGDQPDKVLEAWAATHSLNGAARWLNDHGIPSWSGSIWNASQTRKVLARLDPNAVPLTTPSKGAKPVGSFRLHRLLRCQCGAVMTGFTDRRRGRETVLYRCHRAGIDSGHSRTYRVREDVLLPYLMAEAAHLAKPDAVSTATTSEAKRAALGERRSKVVTMFEMGAIDKDDLAKRLGRIDDELGMLETERRVVAVPDVDWDADPAPLNAVLALLWERVDLGPDLTPVSFTWRLPELRRD